MGNQNPVAQPQASLMSKVQEFSFHQGAQKAQTWGDIMKKKFSFLLYFFLGFLS
ncbi:unnamed protein product, partial [marine sediment metagenome]